MPTYREMVTTDGRFNVREIMAHAHRRAQHEFNCYLLIEAGVKIARDTPVGEIISATARLAATVDCSKIKAAFSYAELFARELTRAWGWARAIRGAGQGEAAGNVAPMFRRPVVTNAYVADNGQFGVGA